jgi:hypothetical protein
VRANKIEFKYERGVQPTPKLGDWVEVLTEILELEAKLPKRERRFDAAAVRGAAWARLRRRARSACIGSSKHGAMNASEFRSKPMCDVLCAWRSLPVRQDTVTTVARVRRDAADCGVA